jgi:hypothetical protein
VAAGSKDTDEFSEHRLEARNMHQGPVAQLVDGIQQRTDLREASPREVAVILPGAGAQQGDPLQTEQIRQRVLVDRRWLDAGL